MVRRLFLSHFEKHLSNNTQFGTLRSSKVILWFISKATNGAVRTYHFFLDSDLQAAILQVFNEVHRLLDGRGVYDTRLPLVGAL